MLEPALHGNRPGSDSLSRIETPRPPAEYRIVASICGRLCIAEMRWQLSRRLIRYISRARRLSARGRPRREFADWSGIGGRVLWESAIARQPTFPAVRSAFSVPARAFSTLLRDLSKRSQEGGSHVSRDQNPELGLPPPLTSRTQQSLKRGVVQICARGGGGGGFAFAQLDFLPILSVTLADGLPKPALVEPRNQRIDDDDATPA